jgi:hypothetical protein
MGRRPDSGPHLPTRLGTSTLFGEMSETGIPTEAEWRSEPWGIDTPCAYRDFFGKTLAQAFDLFVKNALYYQEDIMFMPLACFRYYLHAYIDYLLSDKSVGDSDGASAFFGIVECRSDDINCSDEVLRSRVSKVLFGLRDGQHRYGAEPEVYGDFRTRADEAIKLIER